MTRGWKLEAVGGGGGGGRGEILLFFPDLISLNNLLLPCRMIIMFLLLHISTSNQLHFKVGSETGSAFHFLPARAWRWGKGGGGRGG